MKELYELIINMIKTTDSLSEQYNLLNTQEYLNWKDELNKLSLDRE